MVMETPGIVIDVEILQNNIARMALVANQNSVALRPHTKTHKTVEIAKMQLDAGACGITVAKVSEAEVMAGAGIRDIFIAYPVIGPGKVERLLALSRENRIIAGVDSFVGAKALGDAAVHTGQVLEVRLEIDIGYKRSGVPYEEAVALACRIDMIPGLKLTGIYVFKGLTYQGKPTTDRQLAAMEEGRLAVEIAGRIRDAGVGIVDVSVGSTPTADLVASCPGITEIRPGTYVFNDVTIVRSGTCRYEDCAARVLTTVISTPEAGRLVIDGGSKTFATDTPFGVFPYFFDRYGKIMEEDGLVLDRLSEEHGMVRILPGAKSFAIGDQLTIIPNHVCPTVNLHDKLCFVKKNELTQVVAVAARGKVY